MKPPKERSLRPIKSNLHPSLGINSFKEISLLIQIEDLRKWGPNEFFIDAVIFAVERSLDEPILPVACSNL